MENTDFFIHILFYYEIKFSFRSVNIFFIMPNEERDSCFEPKIKIRRDFFAFQIFKKKVISLRKSWFYVCFIIRKNWPSFLFLTKCQTQKIGNVSFPPRKIIAWHFWREKQAVNKSQTYLHHTNRQKKRVTLRHSIFKGPWVNFR